MTVCGNLGITEMQFDRYKKGEIMVVAPHGWPREGDAHKLLRDELVGLIDKGETAILLDLSALDYMTSGGLAALLNAARRMADVKGRFALCSLNDNLKSVFDISNFAMIIDIYPSVDEALANMT